MKRFYSVAASFLVMLFLFAGLNANAQDRSRERFTGTVLIYGEGFNTRTVTRLFTLDITNRTSDSDAQRYLGILQENNNQDRLVDAIDNQELGRFSIGSNVGVPINVVRESTVDGKQRIFVVFRRLTGFGELRGGYRSLDYPFGVIEMFVDPRTGKGEGTYIAAAQIRWKNNNRGTTPTVEIENFATYPAKLLGVRRR